MGAPLPPAERKDRPYAEELVFTTAEDGVTLEGAVIRPRLPFARDERQTQPIPQDIAVVWMHGLTSRFYSRTAVGIGRELAARGFTFITGNNRGHDFGFVLRRAPGGRVTLGGGGWERFSESPHDIGAWVTFATNLGFRGVLLAGHSLGALKVGYYQALRQDDRVLGIVAVSPPVAASRVDPELLALAEHLAADGRAQELLPWGSSRAGAGSLSAGTYLDRVRTGLDIYGFHPIPGQPTTPPSVTMPASSTVPLSSSPPGPASPAVPLSSSPPSPASPAEIGPPYLASILSTTATTSPSASARPETTPTVAHAMEGVEELAQTSGTTHSTPEAHPVSRIRCPIFACYGTDEAWVGGAAELDAIRRAATAASRVETCLFAGADHSYIGHESAVATTLAEWATVTSLATPPAELPTSSA